MNEVVFLLILTAQPGPREPHHDAPSEEEPNVVLTDTAHHESPRQAATDSSVPRQITRRLLVLMARKEEDTLLASFPGSHMPPRQGRRNTMMV
jgi:hypothetical protein